MLPSWTHMALQQLALERHYVTRPALSCFAGLSGDRAWGLRQYCTGEMM